MNYNIDSLIDRIKYEFSDEFIAFYEYAFKYDDCVAYVTGHIEEHWKYDYGDYWTPPTAYFISRHAEIENAYLMYDDCVYELTEEEIEYIEQQLQKE